MTTKEYQLSNPEAFSEIITSDSQMISAFQYVESIAPTLQPVLITGETGVGKDLIARCIHKLSRLKGKFIAVNVAGLDDNVFSDTLFGHAKGAYTGAESIRQGLIDQARGGTLFLDEIGDLSPASQVKLLRLIQQGEYLPLGQDEFKESDARILTATNENIWILQREGKFRKDLNFRLRTHHINIPPLRERKVDIRILADHFIRVSSETLLKQPPTPPKELYSLLESYSFPGNIRELESMIFDLVSRHKSRVLSLKTLKEYIEKHREETLISESSCDQQQILKFSDELPTIKQATDILITEAMARSKGSISIAAQMLGISPQALSKRLKKKEEHP